MARTYGGDCDAIPIAKAVKDAITNAARSTATSVAAQIRVRAPLRLEAEEACSPICASDINGGACSNCLTGYMSAPSSDGCMASAGRGINSKGRAIIGLGVATGGDSASTGQICDPNSDAMCRVT